MISLKYSSAVHVILDYTVVLKNITKIFRLNFSMYTN